MADLSKALVYNPFEGDFGDQGDRELRDKIVKFRKAGGCHLCGNDVKPGTLGRSLTMLWATDGVMTYRYCTECTEAQASSWTDDGRALDVRYAERSRSTARRARSGVRNTTGAFDTHAGGKFL